MKNIWSVLSVSGALLISAACSSGNFEAPPPKDITPPPPTPSAPVSTVSVSLTVPVAQVAKLVNEKTPPKVADVRNQPIKCAIGKCQLTLDASRTGPIGVAVRDNALKIDVPFAANAYFVLPGLLSAVKTEAHVRGKAALSALPSLGANWQVQPHLDGKMELQNSRIHVGPLDTDLASIWNANADLLSHPLFRLIDKTISDGLREGPQVAKIWNAAFKPIKVSNAPAAWISLQPERIRIGQLSAANDALSIALALDVRAQLSVQDAAPAVQVKPLPAPAPMNGTANRFRVSAPVVLSYDAAAKIALDNMTKNPPHSGNYTIKVSKLTILPSGQDVVVQSTFCVARDGADALAACGTGYLRGVPRFDAASNSLKIDNLHYDLQTANWMMHVAATLADPVMERELAKGFSFDLSKELTKIQKQITEALAKPQGKEIVISGKVDGFGTPALTWTKDGFLALMPAEGSLKTEVHL